MDGDGRAADADVALAAAVHLAADLDLSARNLPDLVDLGALTADDRANQLRGDGQLALTSDGTGATLRLL